MDPYYEKQFKNDAKSIVDALFEKKYFDDDVTRDQLQAIEELIQYLMTTRFESYMKIEKLSEKWEKMGIKKN